MGGRHPAAPLGFGTHQCELVRFFVFAAKEAGRIADRPAGPAYGLGHSRATRVKRWQT